jgi:Fic family protein
VPQSLSDWERFVALEDELPLLIKIGLARAQFATIHPFLAGNGRVARLLIAFHLCARGALSKPVLYLSHYFKQHRQEYYQRLQAVRDRGDWEGWLTFMRRGVQQIAQQATQTAREIVAMRELHRNIIATEFGRSAANGLIVLESLYARPILVVKDVIELAKISFASANDLIKRFVDHQLLSEITGQARNRRFRYGPYIKIFAENV